MFSRLAFALLIVSCVEAQESLTLEPSISSPATVGTMVTWTASASGPAPLWYRFRVRRIGEDFRTVKDFGPDNSFEWTAADYDGVFEIEASVRGTAPASAIASTKARFQMLSNITAGFAKVTATSHPLVFLYSAPPCAPEHRIRVRFHSAGEPVHYTDWKPCKAGASVNFYLAGMYPQTGYTARHIIDTGTAFEESANIHFATAKEKILPASQTVIQGDGEGLLLQSDIVKNVIATDLSGKLLWYYPKPVMLMTSTEPGGYFWALSGNGNADLSHQTITEFDLAGTTISETNVARINEQLTALGKPPITGFHHDVSRLPDGRIVALGTEERILTGVQSPGPVDVIGDAVIVLDRDLQLVWTWDAFASLDVKRRATLGETCASCATLAKMANDWTHTNSVEQTPDGNLLISVRNQDFIYKIDYENGAGDGHVIWKLGKGGDFTLNVADPGAWFSHQHDAHYTRDGSTITLYDDSNVRRAADPYAHSRGQAIRIDEKTMTAELILDADLGVFSSALGSGQKLPGGHYQFLSGFLPGNTSLTTEVDAGGRIVYQLATGAQQYRSFRMRDLYTPPQ